MLSCPLKVDEGLLRSAISRAYYAVFTMMRHALGPQYEDLNYLRQLSELRKCGVHELIINILKESGHPDLADKLFHLRRKRVVVDYDVYVKISHKDLVWTVTVVREVLSEVCKRFRVTDNS